MYYRTAPEKKMLCDVMSCYVRLKSSCFLFPSLGEKLKTNIDQKYRSPLYL